MLAVNQQLKSLRDWSVRIVVGAFLVGAVQAAVVANLNSDLWNGWANTDRGGAVGIPDTSAAGTWTVGWGQVSDFSLPGGPSGNIMGGWAAPDVGNPKIAWGYSWDGNYGSGWGAHVGYEVMANGTVRVRGNNNWNGGGSAPTLKWTCGTSGVATFTFNSSALAAAGSIIGIYDLQTGVWHGDNVAIPDSTLPVSHVTNAHSVIFKKTVSPGESYLFAFRGNTAGDPASYATLTGSVSVVAPAQVQFDVDVVNQVSGNQVFQQPDCLWSTGGWIDTPPPILPTNWSIIRSEGTVTWAGGQYGLSDMQFYTNGTGQVLWGDMSTGLWKPHATKDIAGTLNTFVIQAGTRPILHFGTFGIPTPLIEGGWKAGTYGYNIRQPNNYPKWKTYIESCLQWLIDTYGREEVRQWGFMFGYESDFQTRAVYPGTQTDMSEADNRREFLKMLDWFHAACTNKLGPTAYVGCYFALDTQASDYLRHWATGTNFFSGLIGTRIAWCGISDWGGVGDETMNPFNTNRPNPWSAGLVGKYNNLTNFIGLYPQLKQIEVLLPEVGNYLGSEGHVADADHRGAALNALRTAAYGQCPRLKTAFHRYAFGTGDTLATGSWYQDDVKAPVFHVTRIQKWMQGERVLPVTRSGTNSDDASAVRAIASASDGPGNLHRVLLVNWNPYFDAGVVESVRLRLTNFPPQVTSLTVRQHLIDAAHNNWWQDWQQYRAQQNIPYQSRGDYLPSRLPTLNAVYDTLRNADLGFWQARLPQYRLAGATLSETSGPTNLPVVGGAASMELLLPPQSVMYLEVAYDNVRPARGSNLGFESGSLADWTTYGTCGVSNNAHGGLFAARLTPAAGADARLTQLISGLIPNATYTLSGWARASGRVMEYALYMQRPSGTANRKAWGDYSGMWRRLVVTTQASSTGQLLIGLEAPAQAIEPGDHVLFDDLTLLAEPAPRVNLNYSYSGSNLQLTWPQGILLEATNLVGPWITNAATSPYTIAPIAPQKFYRLLLP